MDPEELREHVAQRIGKLARPLGDTSTLRDPSIVEELASRLREA